MATATKDLATFMAKLRELMPELRDKYHISSLGVFGSYARGEQKKRSDLDVLVEFSKTPSLFTLVGLEQLLTKRLGVRVDLVIKADLRPFVLENVLRDLILIKQSGPEEAKKLVTVSHEDSRSQLFIDL